jgi:type II secretory pathway pseudopilin PulG
MIVSALLGILIVAATGFLVTAQRNEKIVNDASQQQQNARNALEQLARSAREAQYPQGYNYSNSVIISSADKFEVSFFTDVDDDGTVDKVRYVMSTGSTDLNQEVYAPDCSASPCEYPDTPTRTKPVITEVRNRDLGDCGQAAGSTAPLFRFYKADRGTGNLVEIATPTAVLDQLVDISYFEVNVFHDITPGRSPVCQNVKTSVNLRNWRGS